jgi:hypothetical protein
LTKNISNAKIDGIKIIVEGPLTGPTGKVRTVRAVWQITPDGFYDLITAHGIRK